MSKPRPNKRDPKTRKSSKKLEDSDNIPDPLIGDFTGAVEIETELSPPQKPLVLRLIINNWVVFLPIIAILSLTKWPVIGSVLLFFGTILSFIYKLTHKK